MRSLSLIAVSSLFFTSVFAQEQTEEGLAQILDVDEECKPYSYPDVQNHLSEFPKSWDQAHILPTDSEGQAKWNSIKDSVPNLTPKGGADGNFYQYMSTYPPSDPDCWWSFKQCIGDGDVAKVPEPLTIGFGFDDGPNCSHNAFYDFLQQNNQKATMFYIGSNVLNWPLQAKRGVSDGHEICVLSLRSLSLEVTVPVADLSLLLAMKAIELVTGVTPDCWRPPEGDVDNRIRAIAKGLGLDTILWEYDSEDWQVNAGKATPEQVDTNYQNFINDAKNGKFDKEGAIILQHEINNYTMTEAMKWYPQMKEVFKSIVPVGVALDGDKPSGNGSTSAGSSGSASRSATQSSASHTASASADRSTSSGNGAFAHSTTPSVLLALAALSFGALTL
ncbi:hypothetical protein PM082_002042 [Marasmius tenuissimus]|nr:hypothetical protein PM082_002042 [Marasmius tenuissimus]